MNIILVGCEYAGKTTLANEIVEWSKRTFGSASHFHDHFTIPSSELSPEAKAEYRAANPQIKEMFQRFMIEYHTSPDFFGHTDHNLMGAHIEEAIYAPLYYGYGGKNSGAPFRSAEGQRTEMARRIDENILERAPSPVLVLMKASHDTIAGRMAEGDAETRQRRDSEPFGGPTRGVVKAGDVEFVLQRFDEEYAASLIPNRFTLDTTSATVEETMAEFEEKIEPYLSDADKARRREHAGSA